MLNCFQKRRECLAKSINLDNDIIVIESGKLQHRNGDVMYSFRQSSNFYYLTGFLEQNAILVILNIKGNLCSILFCQEKNKDHEIWHGPIMGPKRAQEELNFTFTYSIDDFASFILDNMTKRRSIHILSREQRGLEQKLNTIILKKYPNYNIKFRDVTKSLHQMRIFKDNTEISLLERAADISVCAHKYAMSKTRPGLIESQVEARLLSKFMDYGCRQVAYESIVAAGANSCILHYTKNNSKLQSGDLLLIDAGAEFENYASDITRTFPINGKFSSEQRAIYQVVLDTQIAVIAAIKPGVAWEKLQEISEVTIIKGLVKLGILSGNVKNILRSGQHKNFYMHGFGHWLGLDVHDVGLYKNNDGSSRILEPGMVFTVEPGIYISSRQVAVDPKWQNIGIRIEDDILVTTNGCRVLTKALPKDIDTVEDIVGSCYA